MADKTDPRKIGERTLRPESLMMSYGYKPEWSEGAVKPPIYQTSTFVFKNAEEGKAFFEVAYGLREKNATEKIGLIYSRLNNPDTEILEDRLTLWDEAESAAVFDSGMAAISTVMLEFLNPGDFIVHSDPVYGGTDHFMKHVLTRLGIQSAGFQAGCSADDFEEVMLAAKKKGRVGMVFIETPANPTNALVDIEMCVEAARRHSTPDNRILVVVDNTFLGPIWQHPLKLGADLVLYSATKFLGGHSDLVGGAVLGPKPLMDRVRTLRTFFGSLTSPWTGWLLLRSLETLKLRMTCQMKNAVKVSDFLLDHPKVGKVYYPGNLEPGTDQHRIYKNQCLAPGSIVSFDVKGGEAEAFKFLNALQLMKLAVSLGGTESLAEHPATMTHADVSPAGRELSGLTGKLVRLSIGVEHPDDIIADIEQALDCM